MKMIKLTPYDPKTNGTDFPVYVNIEYIVSIHEQQNKYGTYTAIMHPDGLKYTVKETPREISNKMIKVDTLNVGD